MRYQRILAAVVFLAAGAGLSFLQTPSLQVSDAQQQAEPLTVDTAVVEQLSALQPAIEKEVLANTPINIEDFGGWPALHAKIGTIHVPDAGIECDVIYGDSNSDLYKGACFYPTPKTRIPGGGLQMLLAAHNNAHFHTLGGVQVGSKVHIDTFYGSYEYEVAHTEVVSATDSTKYDLDKTEEELIMYTCYPFDMLSATPYRFFVYCKPTYARPIQ